jgi:alkylhydroperoxidase family enzyme
MSAKARVQAAGSNTGNLIADSALGLVPETLQHYLPLNTAIWDDGPLNAAEIELARLRNAHHVGCVFCKAVRYDIAIEAGLDENMVQMINDDFRESELTSREKLILAFTDQYLNNPSPPAEELRQQLQEEFSREELLQLSLVVAYFNGFSRCAVALGGMPDELPRMEISVPR